MRYLEATSATSRVGKGCLYTPQAVISKGEAILTAPYSEHLR